MKRIGSVILVLAFLIGVMQIAVSAQGDVNNFASACSDFEIDVYIPKDLSPEVQAKIHAYMFGTEELEPKQDRDILCTLFGHNYEISYSYTVTHNVYTTSPKCLQKTYTTSTCTRCGYTETELTSTKRISICHG